MGNPYFHTGGKFACGHHRFKIALFIGLEVANHCMLKHTVLAAAVGNRQRNLSFGLRLGRRLYRRRAGWVGRGILTSASSSFPSLQTAQHRTCLFSLVLAGDTQSENSLG